MSLDLQILDRTYKLGCEPEEEQQLRNAANFLTQKLREARSAMPRIETERLAVLVALNLAQEILNLNKTLQEQTSHQRILKQLVQELEKAVEE